MKAHELAKRLLEGPDLEVTVRGYEGGVNIINHISQPDTLVLNVHPEDEWYYGSHEYTDDYHDFEYRNLKKIQAIHIGCNGTHD